jgi:asparagine synthase (glutamine-hydrolysing)
MNSNKTGFSLICTDKAQEDDINEVANIEHINVAGKSYIISYSNNVSKITINDSIIYIDGYTFPDDFQAIASAVEAENYQYLNRVDGHFCGVVISNDGGVIGFNDRYGGKTLYWQKKSDDLIITSRIAEMPIHDLEISQEAMSESFYYRWTTGRNTLLSSINKLLVRHIANFSDNDNISQESYWKLPEPMHNDLPLSRKVQMAKTLLIEHLERASQKYKKVAIFFSGGVDSSILAALSKDIFEQCYLITPVFSGEQNPELENAKLFAESLGLEHHLVEIEPSTLTDDLKLLLASKREPLRHYSSLAMMAMMKAVPEGYDAVIYGETADVLYGSDGIKRFITHGSWKKQSQNIPLFLLKLLKKLLPGRGKVLVQLKDKPLRDILLSTTGIKYSKSEAEIIKKLCGKANASLTDWQWNKNPNEVSSEMLRHAVQERKLGSSSAVHFSETEIIAQYYSKHIISPFLSEKSINLSRTLSDDDYLGDSYVKPVLRELACEFFPRELIYQQKHGFPVPFVSWLNGPLHHLITNLKAERTLFDGNELDNFTVSDNFEIYWLLINWQLLNQYFNEVLIADDSN